MKLFTTQKTKFLGIFSIFFLTAGISLLAGAFFIGKNTYDNSQSMSEGVGTVVSLEQSRGNKSTTYKPVVSFTDSNGNERQFTGSVGSNPPSYSVGDAAQIYFDPQGIKEPMLQGFGQMWFLPLLLGSMGTVFAGVGGIVFSLQIQREKRITWLQTNGMVIEAIATDVIKKTNIKSNGKSPYVIQAQWHDTSIDKIHVFESDYLWYDPSEYVTRGQKIVVHINPQKPAKEYWMNITFLPN